MDYLITGGAGFVGSHLVKRLLDDGHEVYIFDNFSTGDTDNLPEAANLTRVWSDPRKYDAVFHLAAQCSQAISFDDPHLDCASNQTLTLDLLDWCKKNGTERFIFTSSMATYGHGAALGPPEGGAQVPTSYYGIHKVAAEGYVRLSGLNYTTFRLQTVYGPGQNLANRRQGIISIFLAMMLADEPIVMKGALSRYRDFVHVDDVVDAMIKSLDTPATYCQTYNLGTGIATSLGDMLDILAEAAGYDGEIKEGQGSTPGDHHGAVADIRRIVVDLGWVPKIELKEGIEGYVEDCSAGV
jgi:UDP-glucose 4-epimerase